MSQPKTRLDVINKMVKEQDDRLIEKPKKPKKKVSK